MSRHAGWRDSSHLESRHVQRLDSWYRTSVENDRDFGLRLSVKLRRLLRDTLEHSHMKSVNLRMLLLLFLLIGSTACLSAQQSVPAPRISNQNPNGMHVYLQAGLKTHQVGQHDYPQFLPDLSKILTDHRAIVGGPLHQPSAAQLENIYF